jgi:hypothetical protein
MPGSRKATGGDARPPPIRRRYEGRRARGLAFPTTGPHDGPPERGRPGSRVGGRAPSTGGCRRPQPGTPARGTCPEPLRGSEEPRPRGGDSRKLPGQDSNLQPSGERALVIEAGATPDRPVHRETPIPQPFSTRMWFVGSGRFGRVRSTQVRRVGTPRGRRADAAPGRPRRPGHLRHERSRLLPRRGRAACPGRRAGPPSPARCVRPIGPRGVRSPGLARAVGPSHRCGVERARIQIRDWAAA